jgi:pimeloyl-ACP methyl ester carboxylesterase
MNRAVVLVFSLLSSTALAQPELDLTYANGETQSLVLAGGEISYLRKGDGPPVLFYHPSVDLRYWQWAIEAASIEFQAIALPLNEIVPGASPTGMTGLLAAIEALDQGKINLVAHSMGGRQALELAIARPDVLLSLTVIEPAGAPDIPSLQALGIAMANSSAVCGLPNLDESLIDSCVLQSQINEPAFFENAPNSLIEILIESARRVAPLQAAAAATQDSNQGPPPIPFAPICEQLGEIDVPILFVRGELTPSSIQASLDSYESCLPEHDSATISGSAHYPHVYNPTDFNSRLLEFLRLQ